MYKFSVLTALAAAVALGSFGPAHAADIMDEKQCLSAVKDAEEAIAENPVLGDKAEKILLEVMTLARQRCDEKQFSNATDLLDLARGMVAAE